MSSIFTAAAVAVSSAVTLSSSSSSSSRCRRRHHHRHAAVVVTLPWSSRCHNLNFAHHRHSHRRWLSNDHVDDHNDARHSACRHFQSIESVTGRRAWAVESRNGFISVNEVSKDTGSSTGRDPTARTAAAMIMAVHGCYWRLPKHSSPLGPTQELGAVPCRHGADVKFLAWWQ